MGFRPEPTVYVLEFEDDLTGLEVRMGSLTVGEFGQMMRKVLVVGVDDAAVKANDEILALFADNLISWNLEDKHGPVPATLGGVESQEQRLIMRVFTAWQRAMNEVDADLEKDSSSGAITLEASLGMAGQSITLPSGLKAS